ncbi:MAG TPA: hypothetical protein VNM72_14200 [Blastocatellia bacterium]|nr:hypothetical protein [Blastocatellia bacterium]
MRKIWSVVIALTVLSATASAQGFRTVAVYNVLDAGNDNTGGITRNNATSGNLGATTGQERTLAVRPGEPIIVYIARGAVQTGDGRAGGEIGLAAILLQSKSDGDFNPRTMPDLPLNYIDTGLIVSGGSPAPFSFIHAVFYEPVLDKVWVLDRSSATPRVWYFDGGSVGGAPAGGDVARTAVARNIVSPFVADNASGLGGQGYALAVRVNPHNRDDITVALGMGTHLEVWQSRSGLAGPWTLRFESSNDPDGDGSLPPFGSSSVRDVAFDEQGDIWVTHQQSGLHNYLHRYDGESLGRGILARETFDFEAPSFISSPSAFAGGFNAIRFYRAGETIFLWAVNRGSDGARITVVRYRRQGERGRYSFTAVDGFGSGVVTGTDQDATLATLRLKGSATETQPGAPAPNGFLYLSLPYAATGDLTLTADELYLNGFVVDATKNQTLPTSGIIRVSFPPPR